MTEERIAHLTRVADRRLEDLASLRAMVRAMPSRWPRGVHEKVSRRQVRLWLDAEVRAMLKRSAGL